MAEKIFVTMLGAEVYAVYNPCQILKEISNATWHVLILYSEEYKSKIEDLENLLKLTGISIDIAKIRLDVDFNQLLTCCGDSKIYLNISAGTKYKTLQLALNFFKNNKKIIPVICDNAGIYVKQSGELTLYEPSNNPDIMKSLFNSSLCKDSEKCIQKSVVINERKFELPCDAVLSQTIGQVKFDAIFNFRNTLYFIIYIDKGFDSNKAGKIQTLSIGRNAGIPFNSRFIVLHDNCSKKTTLGKLKIQSQDRLLLLELNDFQEFLNSNDPHYIEIDMREYNLDGNTLAVIMGKDPSTTLIAIKSHKEKFGEEFKNLLIFHDQTTADLAKNVCLMYQNLHVELIRMDFHGALIEKMIFTFRGQLHINLTPGTSSQKYFLMKLGFKNDATLMTIDNNLAGSMRNLENNQCVYEKSTVSPDEYLKIRGVHSYSTTGEINTDGYELLMSDTHFVPEISKYLKDNVISPKMTLNFKQDGNTLEVWKGKSRKLKLNTQNSEWFELFTAHAFKQINAQNMIKNLRITPTSGHTVSETDIVFSYDGNIFCVECKESIQNDKVNFNDLTKALNYTQLFGRFAKLIVAYISETKAITIQQHNGIKYMLVSSACLTDKEMLKNGMDNFIADLKMKTPHVRESIA